MGKYQNKTPVKKRTRTKHNRSGQIVLVVVLSVFLAALLMMFVVPQLLYSLGGEYEPDLPEAQTAPQESDSDPETTETTELQVEDEETTPLLDALAFPAVLENGSLTIDDMFPYSGINPDSDGQDCTNIAAITLRNTSDQNLQDAVVTVVLQDGTECTYRICELPASKSLMAFPAENESLEEDSFCVKLDCEASFADAQENNGLSISVADTTVTVQNTTSEDFANIDVYCHDVFGESYFGGITYKHTISNLAAGQSTTIEITDSILGMVEVVRIAINES